MNAVAAALAFVLCLASCKATAKLTTTKVSYSATAKQNYAKGAKALADKSFEEATKLFKHVQTQFPFSKYATMAELRQADVLRESEKFIAAIDAYKTFIKEHPTHPMSESGYAAFQIGYCYWKLTPSDFFILPPSSEKDQTSTEAAMLAFKRFLKAYPDSKHRKDAERYYQKTLKRLTSHELYVARFYLGRGKPQGAILRLEHVIRAYPEAGVQPEVMFLLGRTYLRLKKPKKAREVFRALVKKFPGDYNAKKAREYLAFIARQYGLN